MTAKATARTLRASRRPIRAVEQVHETSPQRPSLARWLLRVATSRQAKAAYIVIGTAGLAALAIAIVGPKRLEREVVRPLRGRVEHEADRLWIQSRPLRAQFAGLFNSAGTAAGREKLVRNFQSWIGHFHAS
jgi:hypothetical protein